VFWFTPNHAFEPDPGAIRRAAKDGRMRQNAEALARIICAEDGMSTARILKP